jgi:hypothetical protein
MITNNNNNNLYQDDASLAKYAQYRADILQRIHTHLGACPTGFVIFDEAELPHRTVQSINQSTNQPSQPLLIDQLIEQPTDRVYCDACIGDGYL